MSDRLDGLMGWTVFSETDTVVCGDGDGTEFGEGGETHCSRAVRDKVEEGAAKGDDCAVGGETVHDRFHGMFTDAVADVPSRPVAKFGVGLTKQ